MTILGIETSCDETGVALVKQNSDNSLTLLSNIVASSLSFHARTGGIIPEVAAREQIKVIIPTLQQALEKGLGYKLGNPTPPTIDAIAVTYGPGLIGSLLVGVETAKTLSLLWNKPLIPVNHMHGHLYVNWLEKSHILLPAVVLIVSGGHTDLLLLKENHNIEVIGGTRDDAAGEAFDKIGRLLSLPYPAGPLIAKLAEQGDAKHYPLPRPMLGSNDFDFSFSGLKTAVLNLIKQKNWNFADDTFLAKNKQLQADLSASVEEAIVDVLVSKTIKAAKAYDVKSLILGGGVAANEKLQTTLTQKVTEQLPETTVCLPRKDLCTDNGAMIAAAGFFTQRATSWKDVEANPQLYY